MIKINNVYKADNGDVFVKIDDDYNLDEQDWDAIVKDAQSREPEPCKAILSFKVLKSGDLYYERLDGTFICDSAFLTSRLIPHSCMTGFYLHKKPREKTGSERLASLALAEARRKKVKKQEMDYEILKTPVVIPEDLADDDEADD